MRVFSLIFLAVLLVGCVEPLEEVAFETQTQSLNDFDGNGIPEIARFPPTAADFVQVTSSTTRSYLYEGYEIAQIVRWQVHPLVEYTDMRSAEGPRYHQCRLLPLPHAPSDEALLSIRGEFHGVSNATPDTIPNAPGGTIVTAADSRDNRVVGTFSPLDPTQAVTVSWDGWVTLSFVCSTIEDDGFVDGDIEQAADVHVGTFTDTVRAMRPMSLFRGPTEADSVYYGTHSLLD